MSRFTFNYAHQSFENTVMINADCFDWLDQIPPHSIHAIVTDPPYGVKEFEREQLDKLENGKGGMWRIPPTFDGHKRSPVPRFTALTSKERESLFDFFALWAKKIERVLLPGGHAVVASNAFLSHLVFPAIASSGLEFRTEVVRLVRTLRGGDRPKNAESEFSEVSSTPRGAYEPWGLFRKPLPIGMRVSDCLRTYQTGGLRRNPDGTPFTDVIASTRTPAQERAIAPHPSLKPQSFLRQLVYAVLPLGVGTVLDPFAGSGSTLAACEALGISGIGIERDSKFFQLSLKSVPALAAIKTDFPGMLKNPDDLIQHHLL
jgi:site-specific DNA-methyltransferase (adenine-specific)